LQVQGGVPLHGSCTIPGHVIPLLAELALEAELADELPNCMPPPTPNELVVELPVAEEVVPLPSTTTLPPQATTKSKVSEKREAERMSGACRGACPPARAPLPVPGA
jgi:hypothetical protein